CDHATIMNDGVILASGEPSQIVDDPGVRKVYLGEHFRM
ncbi:MAG: LPS export ABC transporter ATP-binding protein, partial [Burkholderiaceae bacterium]